MAESRIKIRASVNEIYKHFVECPSKLFYIKHYNSKYGGVQHYKENDEEIISFEVLIRHNEIGKRSIERKQAYTLETLEKKLSELVKEYDKEQELVKVGFNYDKCSKSGNIIIGKGTVYYYANEEDYNECKETSITDFNFKYDINSSEVYDVKCADENVKKCVEMNEDNFTDNIKDNLLPYLEEKSIKDKDIADDITI